MRLPLTVSAEIRRRALFEPGSAILVGLSGGPDSVALLRCLLELARKRDLRFQVYAAHLNHGLRGEAAKEDQRFCERLARKLDVTLLVGEADVPAAERVSKRSMEETGRLLRRDFLCQAAALTGCAYLALAQHADDQAETLLYRLCRGTGLEGLRGMAWSAPAVLPGQRKLRNFWRFVTGPTTEPPSAAQNVAVVRPLLGCFRQEILEYLSDLKQTFREDASNLDTSIARNALRHEVIPLLEAKVHAGVRLSLVRLAEAVGAEPSARLPADWLAALDGASATRTVTLTVPKGGLRVPDEFLQALYRALCQVWGLDEGALPARKITAWQALLGRAGTAREIALAQGILVRRAKEKLLLTREK
jgi:tRNA(Ile)-lysidine synthase